MSLVQVETDPKAFLKQRQARLTRRRDDTQFMSVRYQNFMRFGPPRSPRQYGWGPRFLFCKTWRNWGCVGANGGAERNMRKQGGGWIKSTHTLKAKYRQFPLCATTSPAEFAHLPFQTSMGSWQNTSCGQAPTLYNESHLRPCDNRKFHFWSPIVPLLCMFLRSSWWTLMQRTNEKNTIWGDGVWNWVLQGNHYNGCCTFIALAQLK